MKPWIKALIAFVYLSVMLVMAYQSTEAPSALPDSDIDYSLLRQHLDVVAEKPHPIGSQANHEVRDYIVDYFEALGLTTEIQRTTVVYRHPTRASSSARVAYVENIIARLPGSGGPALGEKQDLVLMAHYDSRENARGAGDDGSGTVAALETARVMSAATPPVHDVLFLITDGEEMGLLGAQAFFRQHPMSENVGLVLNFEARGSSGRSSLFETSVDNAWLVEHIIKAVPDLNGDSSTYEIYKRMPNDTDLSISKGEGIPGLNFAFSKGYFDYHAITDSPANLNPDTLAQQANNALFATRYFANLKDWQTAQGDMTFFDSQVAGMVSYSQSTALFLGIAVLLFGVVVLIMALRLGKTSFKSIGAGLIGLTVVFIFAHSLFESVVGFQVPDNGNFYPWSDSLSWLVALGEWPLLGYFCVTLGGLLWLDHALKRGMTHLEVVAPPLVVALIGLAAGTWLMPAILVLLVIPFMSILRILSQRVDLWSASLFFWWLISLLLVITAPNASYLFIIPLFSILLGIALQQRLQFSKNTLARLATVITASFVPLLMLGPLAIGLYVGVGTSAPQVVMGFVALTIILIWPLFRQLGAGIQGKVAVIFLLLGIIPTIMFMTMQSFDSRHPRGEDLFYVVDVDQQKSFWASRDVSGGDWLETFIGKDTGEFDLGDFLPGASDRYLTRDTPMADIEAARISVLSDSVESDERKLELHLQSPSKAGFITILINTEAGVSAVAVNGLEVDVPNAMPESGWWPIRWIALPETGGNLSLTLSADHAIKLRILELDRELPENAPERPSDSMPELYSFSDSTLIFQTITIN